MFNFESFTNIIMNSYVLSILIAFITAVLGPYVVEWSKNKFAKKPESPLKEAFDFNDVVNTQLEDIMDELHCDTAAIIQFHNGGHFYPTGKSIQKFSVFYEKTAPGATGFAKDLQNVPCSVFPKSLLKVYNDDFVSIPSFEGAYDIYDLDTFNVNYNSKSLYMYALKDLNEKQVSVLVLSYVDTEHTLTSPELAFITNKLGVIGTLLTKYLRK